MSKAGSGGIPLFVGLAVLFRYIILTNVRNIIAIFYFGQQDQLEIYHNSHSTPKKAENRHDVFLIIAYIDSMNIK